MKLTKEQFRQEVKSRGYNVRFKKVTFEGRRTLFVPIIKKDGLNINAGNVFTPAHMSEHRDILLLCNRHKNFPSDEE